MLDEAVHHIDAAISAIGSEGYVATTDTPQRARFEPLKLEDLMEVPTATEQWTEAAGPIAFVTGMSQGLVQMTEAQVVEFTHKIGEERGSKLMHSFISFIDLFQKSLALVENAEARILLAGGGDDGEPDVAEADQPSMRVADVLDAVGCDWIARGHRQPKAIIPDPILPLIAAERASFATLEENWAEQRARSSEALLQRENELSDVNMAARRAVMDAQPTTSAGLLAMIEMHMERNVDHIEDDCEVVFSRAQTCLSRQTANTALPDPVLALLDRDEKLYREANAALNDDWEGEGQIAQARQLVAEAAMMATAPTTIAGFAAMLERWIERYSPVTKNDGLPYALITSLIRAGKGSNSVERQQPAPMLQAAE